VTRTQARSGDPSPLSRTGDDRAVLCLHGLTGTPFEVRPLGEALAGTGYTVEAPLLAGHGKDVAALAATSSADWLRSAEQAFQALARRTGRRVALVGFSMGGLLALQLARAHADQVAALVVMSAPLRLRSFQVRGIRLLCRVPVALRVGPLGTIPKLSGSDVSDPEMRRQNPGLPAFPLGSLESLLALMADTRALLPSVTAPTLVVHGRQDHTVPLEDSFELTGSLGSPVVERLWLERSFHLVALDVERGKLSDAVTRFLVQHARW
jgi:carboxylesterase